MKKLGEEYKKLEVQEEELKQQVERLKEQIRRKSQTSASEIDSRFNHSNPELDLMNTKYKSLELQQEKLKTQVEKLKQQMREKVTVNVNDIDTRLNQRTDDYEDLVTDLRNREAAGIRAKKELELERAEKIAVEREQAYIDRTYGTRKSAIESADVFKANPTITIGQAKLQCSDDKLIDLVTTKDGNVQKNALDLAIQYKKLANCNYDEVKFLLQQCSGNYKKVNEIMANIQSEFDRLGLEIRQGMILFKGLKLGQYPEGTTVRDLCKKNGIVLPDGTDEAKLIHGWYTIDKLMSFYTYGKGKYIDTFNSGNIMKDLVVADGLNSLTRFDCISYNRQEEIADLIADTLSSPPSKDAYFALGCFKGDMSDQIQTRRMIKEGNDIEEYLSKNPLKESTKVKRADSYEILSNLKFADGVSLKDALTNPQYHDRLSQIQSLKGQSFINDRFMSTSLFDNQAFGNCPVNWDLEVSEGVGATVLDILGLTREGELLLNRGLKVTIIEIDDTIPNGVVNIKAKVEKAD